MYFDYIRVITINPQLSIQSISNIPEILLFPSFVIYVIKNILLLYSGYFVEHNTAQDKYFYTDNIFEKKHIKQFNDKVKKNINMLKT